jgi:hypothetical protein
MFKKLFASAAAAPADEEYQKAVAEFVGAFEVVFHHDWEYAKVMIGDEEEGCTFLEPGLADEVDDWGARGALLEKYRRLRALMKERKIEPQFPFSLERVREFKGRNR